MLPVCWCLTATAPPQPSCCQCFTAPLFTTPLQFSGLMDVRNSPKANMTVHVWSLLLSQALPARTCWSPELHSNIAGLHTGIGILYRYSLYTVYSGILWIWPIRGIIGIGSPEYTGIVRLDSIYYEIYFGILRSGQLKT
jgi:hypothetical protein